MNEFTKWALGTILALVFASFGYTAKLDNSVDIRIDKSENRVVERLDRLERKLDRILEHQ